MNLLLFHAYFLGDDPREQELMRPFPPLGIQYLVAWIRRETSFSVDWHDSTFSDGPEDFYQVIEHTRPNVVGLYGHTLTRRVALEMTAYCRDRGIVVLAGGPDPVQYPDEYFDGGVDIIVVGEGERTLQELLEHLHANSWSIPPTLLPTIDGILFRDNSGQTQRTTPRPLIRPLEALPWPAREQRDMDRYLEVWRDRHGETAISINTSRGCPFDCSWCSKQVYGDTFRRRAVSDVIAEILHIQHTYKPDQLWFVDDVFSINRKWVHHFCVEMVASKVTTPFYLIARPNAVDEAMLAALRSAGCFRIYFSAESGAQHVLDAMSKRTQVEDIYRAARLCREADIEIGVFVMLG